MRQLDRISHALRLWEDRMFLYGIRQRLLPEGQRNPRDELAAIAERAPSLRRVLHKQGVEERLDEEIVPFTPTRIPATNDLLGILYHGVPTQIAAWMGDSRRGYKLTRDLQAILNATSMKSLKWGDVEWPTGAFAIGLEEPIVAASGKHVDCILVTLFRAPTPEGGEMLYAMFRLLTREMEAGIMSPYVRADIVKRMGDPRQRKKLGPILTAAEKKLRGGGHMMVFPLRVDTMLEEPVTTSVTELLKQQLGACPCGKEHPEYEQAVRLTVGLCMYLDSLPDDSPLVTPWQSAPNAVLSGAQSCTVGFRRELDPAHRKFFLGIRSLDDGRSLPTGMGVKYVPGHSRRPPRRKDDTRPDTRTKTVLVEPTIAMIGLASAAQRAELEPRLEKERAEHRAKHPKKSKSPKAATPE